MRLLKLLILTAALSITYGIIFEKRDGAHRTIGGEAITITDVPFQVMVNYRYEQRCAGVILNKDWVLTTANCLLGLEDEFVTVVYNRTSKPCYVPSFCAPYHTNVSKVIRHLDFNHLTHDSDIALINVREKFIFDDEYSPYAAVLPEQEEVIAPGTLTSVAGWGSHEEGSSDTVNHLTKVVVQVQSNATCSIAYAAYGGMTKNMICAGTMEGGRDTCKGDSGSPLVFGNKLLGLASWGHGCGRVGYPGVYTRIPAFIVWITDHMK